MRRLLFFVLPAFLLAAAAASAAPEKRSWAQPQIQRVVAAGLMAPSVKAFRPDDPLTQGELAEIVSGLNERFAPPPAPEPAPEPAPVPDIDSIPNPYGPDEQPTDTDPPAWPVDVPPAYDDPAPTPAWPVLQWKATAPAKSVSLTDFDRVLVRALGLAGAANEIRVALAQAGLKPPSRAGTETVARLLGLRLNHPAGEDALELLPTQPISRAEAAYSVDRALSYDVRTHDWIDQLVAESFQLPAFSDWQRRILRTAVSYVGYPYVWGGTSPGPESPFGVQAAGGFDCSGFVWRVYKLTSYPGSGPLASVLHGRTTYDMSGEVGRAKRIYETRNLKPGDVLFFGKGRDSKPAEVDHTGIYLGAGWMVHSSGNGTTIVPFDGWYARSFAWARRPLREAGLSR